MFSLLPFQNTLENFSNLKPFGLLLLEVSSETFSKALSTPLFGASVIYTILFGTSYLGKQIQGIHPDDNRISVNQAIVAGACSGFAFSSFLAPVDLAKGKLEIDQSIKKMSPRGNMTKAIRDTRSGATYFGCYEYVSKSYILHTEIKVLFHLLQEVQLG